jgi:exonuclease SbcD
MKILHTADWHVGKKIGRIDRTEEYRAVLDEIVGIAGEAGVDVVLHSGDVFDRAFPPYDAIGLALGSLIRLAETGARVVVIAGNHDSPELLGLLAPLLSHRGIVMVPRIVRPGEGGIVEVASRDGSETAQVAALPFLSESRVVDFMEPSEEWFKAYDTRIRLLAQALCEAIDPKAIGILAGHFFVDGSELGGGERSVHIGPNYAATSHSLPATVSYAALGHIHKPQEIPGAPVPARYAGSPLQLDFSERSHQKEVVLVEAVAGRPAKVEGVPLSSGRRLLRVEGSLVELESRASEFGDAYLDVIVHTEGPVFGVADRVREMLPNAVLVRPYWERVEVESVLTSAGDKPLAEAYSAFHESPDGHGVPAGEDLIALFRELEEEVLRAAP